MVALGHARNGEGCRELVAEVVQFSEGERSVPVDHCGLGAVALGGALEHALQRVGLIRRERWSGRA